MTNTFHKFQKDKEIQEMINSISDALRIAKKHPGIDEYNIVKAYDCTFGERHYYAFRFCKKDMDDMPGLTSFLVNVFEDGNVVSGSQVMEPPGGKEVPLP